MSAITQQLLRSKLRYAPETGHFYWLEQRGRVVAGQKAGTPDYYGYTNIRVCGKVCKAHRLAWVYVYGDWPAGEIDHINGNRADNRLCNLRVVSSAQNKHNQHTLRSNKTSQFLGVSWLAIRNKWRAVIGVAGRTMHLGLFDSEHDAQQAYLAAKQKYHMGAPV